MSRWTGIPVTRMQEEETARLLRMEDELHASVVGQDEAIKAVSRAIRRVARGAQDRSAPSARSSSAARRAWARRSWPIAGQVPVRRPSALIRVDMSEYMEKFSVSRLIGAPPGYVGYDDGGR